MSESIKLGHQQLVEANILFFARAREIVGEKEIKRKLAQKIGINELYKFVFEKEFPMLLPIRHCCVLAVNREYRHPQSDEKEEEIVNLHDGIEIAVIPPLSGG